MGHYMKNLYCEINELKVRKIIERRMHYSMD